LYNNVHMIFIGRNLKESLFNRSKSQFMKTTNTVEEETNM